MENIIAVGIFKNFFTTLYVSNASYRDHTIMINPKLNDKSHGIDVNV
jgi:hypothetical protein